MSNRLLEILTKLANASQQFATQFPLLAPGSFRSPHGLMHELTKELESVPEIAKWEKQRVATYFGESEIHFSYLAGAMVERVMDGVAPVTVVDDLMDLFLNPNVGLKIIMGVVGIKVTDSIELSKGVCVLPPSKLPPSKVREEMFDVGRDGKVLHRGRFLSDGPPGAALVIDGRMTVIHGHSHGHTERKELVDHVTLKQARALTCLTLSGPTCAPFIVSASSWVAHPAFPYSGFGSLGYARWQGIAPLQPGDVDASQASNLYSKIEALDKPDWEPIMRATERLQRSRSHMAEADRAIDLGIALEMTLLHEIDREHTELSYRAAVRGAWLLGKNGAERRQIFNALKVAYDARSAAVHTGQISKKKLIENLPEADKFCASAIRHVIEHGFPEQWNSLVLDEARKPGATNSPDGVVGSEGLN